MKRAMAPIPPSSGANLLKSDDISPLALTTAMLFHIVEKSRKSIS
jgi:hypothetical protein